MKQRVGQRDIARECGVDVSTVSLALSGHPRIPEATQARVRAVAERLGYRPDPALASIAASRWQGRRSVAGTMLAFLVDDRKNPEPELKLYEAGIRRQAELLGYGVTCFSWRDFRGVEGFWRVVRSRGIRGVVVGQSRAVLEDALFSETVAPVVHCGFLREIRGDVVRPDLRLAVRETCRRAVEAHGRVACFLPVERELVSDHTILGVAYAVGRIGASVGKVKLVEAAEQPGAEDFRRLERARPQAVVTINEKHAVRLREGWAEARGLPVYTLHTLPPFAGKRGMDLRLAEVGSVSVNLLEMKMRRLPLSTASFRQSLLIEPRWLG